MTEIANPKKILIFVLFAGLILRLFSLNYGLPYIFGPDETRQVLDALSMGARKSLIPLDFTYPALHKYALLLCFGIYFLAGLFARVFYSVNDFIFKFLVDPGKIFLIARGLSVFFGLSVLIPAYLSGKVLNSRTCGVVACVFTAFMFTLSAHSQWATQDMMLCFFSASGFYFILKCNKAFSPRDLLLSACCIGLAAATKYQGAYLAVPFLAMVMLNFRRFRKETGFFKYLFLSILVTGVLALAGNLSFLFEFKASFTRLLELRDEIMGISSLRPFSNSLLSVIFWFAKELIRQETLLGAVLMSGIIYSVYKHGREDLLFLSYIIICFFSITGFGFRSLHILVFALPVICVFGARFLYQLTRYFLRQKYKFSYPIIASFVIIAPCVNNALLFGIKRSNPDTRLEARAWIESNIPAGATIAEDWYEFSVPLESEFPVLFRDDKLRSFYINFFDEGTRRRYRDFAKKKPFYELVQARYESKDPSWPDDMPGEAVERAKNIPLVGRLYRWFNFRSIADLRSEGASYIIISSYSYNHFLLDDDAMKKSGLFNPYMLEDTLLSNRQADKYEPGSKYGLLYFLAKRARDFYLPLLNTERKDVRLLNEFSPGSNNLGPVIKIYKIGD